MRSTIRVLASFAALSAAACMASASLAQAAPQRPATATAADPGMHDHWAEPMRAHAEARARALHAILNIRPDQEAAFHAFLASMKPDGDDMGMHDRNAGEAAAPMTTPERLDKMAAGMAEHQAAFQRKATAVKAFYAALSPEQQRAFDALHDLMGHGHQGFGGPDRHGFGPGEGGMDGPHD